MPFITRKKSKRGEANIPLILIAALFASGALKALSGGDHKSKSSQILGTWQAMVNQEETWLKQAQNGFTNKEGDWIPRKPAFVVRYHQARLDHARKMLRQAKNADKKILQAANREVTLDAMTTLATNQAPKLYQFVRLIQDSGRQVIANRRGIRQKSRHQQQLVKQLNRRKDKIERIRAVLKRATSRNADVFGSGDLDIAMAAVELDYVRKQLKKTRPNLSPDDPAYANVLRQTFNKLYTQDGEAIPAGDREFVLDWINDLINLIYGDPTERELPADSKLDNANQLEILQAKLRYEKQLWRLEKWSPELWREDNPTVRDWKDQLEKGQKKVSDLESQLDKRKDEGFDLGAHALREKLVSAENEVQKARDKLALYSKMYKETIKRLEDQIRSLKSK